MARIRTMALALILTGILAFVTGIRAADPATEAVSAANPAEPPAPPPAVVRVYNVRDLLQEYRDYHIYDVGRADGFSASLDSDQPMGLGSSAPPGPAPAEPLSERVDGLVKELETAVNADSWRDNGGSGTIQPHDGLLIISQSAANHKLVKEFLDELSRANSATVRVEADWVWGSREQLDELLLKSPDVGASLNAIQEVDEHRLAALPPGLRHVHAEVTGRDGQSMFIVSGRERSVVTNVTPIVSTATSSFAPMVNSIGAGAALQVKAMAKPDLGFAMLVISGGYDELGRTRKASAAAVAGAVFESPATTQPSTAQPTTVPSLSADYMPPALRGAARVQSKFNTIEMKVQEIRTSIRVPLGRPVVAAGATWDPKGGEHPKQLLLIITVRAAQ